MKYCEKCHVSVESVNEDCPLCQNTLKMITKNKNQQTFPIIPTIHNKYSLFFRILTVLSIIATTLSFFIDYWLTKKLSWSVFVAVGVVTGWSILYAAVKRSTNITKTIINQVIVVSIFSLIWDLIIGWHSWSITFVLPSVCVCAMVSMGILAKILNLEIEDYMVYIVIDGIFGIVPILFLFTGWLSNPIASVICIITSIISLSILWVFEGKNMIEEINRRFHL